jgi:hypothetical protein
MTEIVNPYPDNTAVKVYDIGRRRWYKGTVLCLCRIDDSNVADGWEVELRNGNRGNWDSNNIRAI